MAVQPEPYVSVAEYLAGERAGDVKHEYADGRVFALASGSARHNMIATNVVASLHAQLRGRECRVYSSDLRVKMRRLGRYTYPDVSALCGTSQFEDNTQDTLLNPSVIIEVLSPSTESYDRGKKFQYYRTLESLQEYILIAQDGHHIDHFLRQDAFQWLLSEVDGLEGTLELSSIQCRLALADVYDKITFDG
jgi:Uma2 family endonuclease